MGKKRTFWGRQKFLADGVAGGCKNRPGANFGHVAHSTSKNFNFNKKQKSYASWKLCNAKKSKIMVAPLPLALNVRIFQVCPEMTSQLNKYAQRFFFSFWNFCEKGRKQFFLNKKKAKKNNKKKRHFRKSFASTKIWESKKDEEFLPKREKKTMSTLALEDQTVNSLRKNLSPEKIKLVFFWLF